MTSEFVYEANKLKNQQTNLERSCLLLIDHLTKEDADLNAFYRELEASRAKELDIVRSETRNIYNPLELLKSQISSDVTGLDLNMIKKDMVDIQNKIQNMRYKHKMMLEKLAKEEKELLTEMHSFEEKLAQWDNRAAVVQTKVFVPKPVENTPICPEITDFMKFVTESGGHEGGWMPEDHTLFVKIRGKYKNVHQMANCIHALCPDIPVEDVLKHEEWYLKYIDLKNKQKQAIKAWRESKNKARELEEIKEEVKIQTKPLPPNPHIKKEVQDKIANWKKEKEMRQISEIETKKSIERKQKETESKKKQEIECLKMEVLKWKTDRTAKDHEEKIRREIAEMKEREYRIANAKKLIKHFQSQDDFFIQRLRKSKKTRSKSLEKLPVRKNNAPRDPDRLLKPTKQWIQRTMPKVEDELKDLILQPVNHVRYVQKLGIPAWRKQI